ncbi:MAG: RsmB/NOP family class I SAM-dependent RNA methyltransferase [Opitutaceae bacterium]|nr:RsmB/NOP family class I SAM-dependent RNA methyltransferase [Opitutaceae bacterium]
MNPSIIANQQRTLIALIAALRPHFRSDRQLPSRIQDLLGRNRSFGSRDRRLYRELIYTTLRYLPLVEPWLDRAPDTAAQLIAWLAADTPATRRFRATLRGDWPEPAATVNERAAQLASLLHESFDPEALLPAWFRSHCPEAFAPHHLDALLSRAPLWLRLQTRETEPVFSEFREHAWAWRRSPVLPQALELAPDVEVARSESYRAGRIEIQDLGSQLVLASVGIGSGQRWLDACAGAGGKTLQLAGLVGTSGQIEASDIRTKALTELAGRAQRAKLANIRILAAVPPAASYDGVLIDAPCSGSGTWRRQPHLKLQTNPSDIDACAAAQRRLLGQYQRHVRAGGRLVYATCSLSPHENQGVVAAFLAVHPDFAPIAPANLFGGSFDGLGLTFLPGLHNTDGFYVAALGRRLP